ncbi:hypothetical protein V8E55_008198 [Tylopilus felleus]
MGRSTATPTLLLRARHRSRIEVIADDEDEMYVPVPHIDSLSSTPSIEASRRMVDRYDLVVTSGIGPTHGDISVSVPLLSSETKDNALPASAWHSSHTTQRSCLSPPISRCPSYESRVNSARSPAFPPSSKRCLTTSDSSSHSQHHHTRPCRLQVFTQYITRHFPHSQGTCSVSLPESSIAPFLATLRKRVNSEGIRIHFYNVASMSSGQTAIVDVKSQNKSKRKSRLG